MPWEVLPLYLKARHEKEAEDIMHRNERMKYEMARDAYMLDQLWAMAAGQKFAKGKGKSEKPTYPRWAETLQDMANKTQPGMAEEDKKVTKVKNISHEDRMQMFLGKGRLWDEK